MKMLIRLLGRCICAIVFISINMETGQCQNESIIPIPDISNKLRREAGPIVDKMDGEEFSSGSRGRFAFKKGKSGFAAFSKSRGGNQTTLKEGAVQTETSIETPTKIRLPLLIAPLASESGLGLSMTEQPNLYWYMSYWWAGELGFTLNQFGTGELIIEDSIRESDCKKHPVEDDLICHIRLADYGVSLEPNKDYEWFVFIVMDPEQRTSDWLSSAFVRYQPSGQLTQRLNSTPLEQHFSVYKENNFWYDAINNVAVQIEQQPKNEALRKKLAGLIEQEKMLNVAEFLIEGCEECYHELGVE
jgi:hypothetical protein